MIRVTPTLTLLLAPAPVAMAAESDISIDRNGVQIVGTLNVHDGVENPPVVLMLHGFTDSRNEFPGAGGDVGLFTHAAAKLAEAGSPACASTSSARARAAAPGRTRRSRPRSRMRSRPSTISRHSTASTGTGQRSSAIARAGSWPPMSPTCAPKPLRSCSGAPVTNPLGTYAGLVAEEVVDRARAAPADEKITAPLSWGGETTLKARFFQELVTTSPVAALSGYPGPVVIVGTKETIVAPQPAAGQVLLNYHDGEKTLVEVDSDALKIFDTVDTELLTATVHWLKGASDPKLGRPG